LVNIIQGKIFEFPKGMSEFWFIMYVNDGGDDKNNYKQFTEKTAACVQNAVDA